jgi:hypothetical protein
MNEEDYWDEMETHPSLENREGAMPQSTLINLFYA